MLKYLANKKTLIYWITAPVALLGIFLLVQPAQASIESSVMTLIGWILLPIIHFLGNVLLLLIEVLIGVFEFSEFIDSAAVQLGWVIVRDIANIGIVAALIIIAFSTVFRIKRYAASQLLVKLMIAAFLVNFSLIITGLIIDFGQVLMMYFVHAFSELVAGNLTVGFGIEQMLQVSKSVAQNPGFDSGDLFSVIGAMILAIVLLIVAIAVIIVFLAVLLQRIVYLWILAIFSPIAWVGPLLPGGDQWSDQWWKNFSNQVFIGPMLAFGFWLSMSILAGISANQSLIAISQKSAGDPVDLVKDTSKVARFVTEVSTPQAIFDFMVTIALLVGTLVMAKQAGGAAGSLAGTVASKLQSGGMAMLKRPFRPIKDTYKAYKSQGESRRSDAASARATKLSMGMGTLKGATGKGLQKITKIPGNELRRRATKKQEGARNLRAEAQRLRSKGDTSGAETKEAEAIKFEDKSKKLQTWGKVADVSVSGAGLIGAGLTGSLLPLIPLLGQVGAKLEKFGAAQKSAGINYKYREFSKERETLKSAKDDDVLKQSTDISGSSFEQMAAIVEALSRDLYGTDEEVKRARARLKELGASDKILSTADAAIERTRPMAALVSEDQIIKKILSQELDIGKISGSALEAEDGRLVKLIMEHGTAGQIAKLLERKESKRGLVNGSREVMDKENYQTLSGAAYTDLHAKTASYNVVAGGEFDKTYNYDKSTRNFQGHGKEQFTKSVQAGQSTALLLNLDVKAIAENNSDNDLAKTIADVLEKHQFSALAANAKNDPERYVVQAIAQAIHEEAKRPGGSAKAMDVSKHINSTPNLQQYAL